MANVIGMAQISTILGLRQRNWSYRRIARELGIDRRTVAGYIKQHEQEDLEKSGAESKCTIVPTEKVGSKCTIVPAGKNGRQSQCEPYSDHIKLEMTKGLTAQRIWQDLRDDYGYDGGYDSVKRYVRKEKTKKPGRIYRMEVLPGEEAQVDFGTGAWIQQKPGEKKRRSWLFRIVLSCSRKGYTESVFSQDTETFIRCIENAFRHFGGVTQTLNIDNLRAAVSKADWYEPEINPKLESFCRR